MDYKLRHTMQNKERYLALVKKAKSDWSDNNKIKQIRTTRMFRKNGDDNSWQHLCNEGKVIESNISHHFNCSSTVWTQSLFQGDLSISPFEYWLLGGHCICQGKGPYKFWNCYVTKVSGWMENMCRLAISRYR